MLTHQRYYQVVAYNGSRFDYYLLLGAMTAEETRLLEPTLQLRGKCNHTSTLSRNRGLGASGIDRGCAVGL
jgi:hypothetical protein